MSKIDSLKKSLGKADITTGLSNPDNWLSTGIYSLNFTMTGDFSKGIPNRRSVLIWGESGTGKSFILGNAAYQAQQQGYDIIMIDTETSLHEEYLNKIGVKTGEDDGFIAIQLSTIDDATKTMSNILKTYDKDDKICVIMDSISMLETESEADNFDKGIQKGSMGQQAKQLKKLIKSINAKVGERDMFFIMSGHSYLNQNVLNGEGIWILSGGKGLQYIPSISVLLTKSKLKDESKDIVGINIKTEVTKTRFTKLGGKTVIPLNYEKGYEPHAGLLDMAVDAGIVNKKGGWYSYINSDGEDVKFQQSKFGEHYLNLFDFDTEADIVETLEGLEEEE